MHLNNNYLRQKKNLLLKNLQQYNFHKIGNKKKMKNYTQAKR